MGIGEWGGIDSEGILVCYIVLFVWGGILKGDSLTFFFGGRGGRKGHVGFT